MKSKIVLIIIMLTFVFGSKKLQAQNFDKSLFIIAWEIGMPVQNNNFLDKTSLSGGKIEYRHFIKENLSIGAFLNWNSYEEYFSTATYENPDKSQATTTDMYRFMYTLPMGFSTHYYFKGGSIIKPFAGIGLGAQYSEQNLYFNIYGTEDKNWGFLVRPELGIRIKPTSWDQSSFLVGATYGYSTNKNTNFGIDNLQNLNFQIGFAWNR